MEQQNVEELYGIKIGDKVKYIGNDESQYNKNLFDKEGEVKNIVPLTGEFHVKIQGIHYDVSFQRYNLLLLEDKKQEEVDFEGELTETNSMQVNEMKSYLSKYHDFKEGIDFSISDRDNKKEVMLTNEKYSSLIKDLLSVEKVAKELVQKKTKDFKHTMLPHITDEGAISLVFKASDWTFKTHLSPWGIQYALLLQYGIDLYEEWGFKNK